MDAMRAAHHGRILIAERFLPQKIDEFFCLGLELVKALTHLKAKRRIHADQRIELLVPLFGILTPLYLLQFAAVFLLPTLFRLFVFVQIMQILVQLLVRPLV